MVKSLWTLLIRFPFVCRFRIPPTLYTMQMNIGNMCNIQFVNIAKENLTVAAEAESVVPFPGG